jgi:hypothetical protein
MIAHNKKQKGNGKRASTAASARPGAKHAVNSKCKKYICTLFISLLLQVIFWTPLRQNNKFPFDFSIDEKAIV